MRFTAQIARQRPTQGSFEEIEQCYKEAIRKPLGRAKRIGAASIVVGISLGEGTATEIKAMLETVRRGLEEFYPTEKCVIVAAGSQRSRDALEVIDNIPQGRRIKRIAFSLDDERLEGKGWNIRAIVEIALALGADLVILEADLRSREKGGEIEGLAPDWIVRLIEPIRRDKADLVISYFNRHYFESPIFTNLILPLVAAIYNRRIQDIGGQWGISYRMLLSYPKDAQVLWRSDIGGHGVDSWLVTMAITSGARICGSNLGIKLDAPSAAETDLIARQMADVLFDQIIEHSEWWKGLESAGESPLLQPLAIFGTTKSHQPDKVQVHPERLVINYQRGFNRYYSLYREILSEEAYRQLKKLAGKESHQFNFPAELWVEIVYRYLLDFAFGREFTRGDLRNSLMALSEGCIAGFILGMQAFKGNLGSLRSEEIEHLAALEARHRIDELVEEFSRQKPEFLLAWRTNEEMAQPLIPAVTYREFIPGVQLVVPLEITTQSGNLVTASGIYESIFQRYQRKFEEFIYTRLELPRDATSEEIGSRIADLMLQVEKYLDEFLFSGDIHSLKGTRQVVEAIFHHFPHHDTFALSADMALWLLRHNTPSDLLTKLGYDDLNNLLRDYEPNDILALASWSEEQDYRQQLWALIREDVRPEHFVNCPLKPVVMDHREFPSLVETKESSALDKITGRVVVSSLPGGIGGQYPKLRYFTTIAKNIVEAEKFGHVWRRFAEEKKQFGERVVNSVEGHWGRAPLSAHNIFENGHQRVLVERIRDIARRLTEEGCGDATRLELTKLLEDMADCYHLAFTLPDGGFIPCSAWTWASYSFKGGTGIPTPLSLFVERDWYSREFLTEYFRAVGGTDEAIEDTIVELMGQGREWQNLSPILLGGVEEAEEVMPAPVVAVEQPPAGVLVRFANNPILGSVKEHPWESKFVFNPGAIKLDGRVYLVYRAVGDDNVSRLGLAVSEDGFYFAERLDEPIFEPRGKSELKGCEDPRLTLIGGRIYMLYTAYDGLVAQIACASIAADDFVNYRWRAWRRHGLVFPGFTDKNATLFPEQFGGKFAMLHRVDPHIWITFSSHLRCPWSRKEHRILAGSTSGMLWDGKKVGAGSQPVKTRYGWLLITHGVDYTYVYRLGVMLLDLTDPTMILYRSPNSILSPTELCEIGEKDRCWVHNVVFTCGAVPRGNNKDLLEAEDEVLVYYGAADTAICVATAKIADLIPIRELENLSE
jgi:predicted GH43/DUF377 family glycosyl hydrolase